jgi:hypothetical protein
MLCGELLRYLILFSLNKQSYIFDKEGVEYADYAAIIAKVKNLKNIDVSETDAIKTDEKIKTFISRSN